MQVRLNPPHATRARPPAPHRATPPAPPSRAVRALRRAAQAGGSVIVIRPPHFHQPVQANVPAPTAPPRTGAVAGLPAPAAPPRAADPQLVSEVAADLAGVYGYG
jgi:hypothetical protein